MLSARWVLLAWLLFDLGFPGSGGGIMPLWAQAQPADQSSRQTPKKGALQAQPADLPPVPTGIKPPGDTPAPAPAPPRPQTGAADAQEEHLSAMLERKRGFADNVGRGEGPGPDGSADVRLKMSIKAPERVITAITLSPSPDGRAMWDTRPGNQAWQLAVTQSFKLVNRRDGSLEQRLPQGLQRFDLWVQDNNSISAGVTRFKLRVEFTHGPALEAEVQD